VASSVPVVLRARARADVTDAIDWYRDKAEVATAIRFVDALQDALRQVGRQPGAGSPRYGVALGLPDLRSWPLSGFPYIVFYVQGGDRVDVWRMLHGRRDIPASLRHEDDSP
jgi:toxin ParE1/3/4